MPNHIQNILVIDSKNMEEIEKVLNAIKFEDDVENVDFNFERPWLPTEDITKYSKYYGTIDFNKIVPIPTGIELKDINYKDINNPNNWYNWSIQNWGTKWNAYEQYFDGENIIRFQTAWANVKELMQKLSVMFPNVTLIYRFADENIGCQVGKYIFKNGKVVFANEPNDGCRTAYELAFSIWDSDAEDYDLTYDEDVDNYVYMGDD